MKSSPCSSLLERALEKQWRPRAVKKNKKKLINFKNIAPPLLKKKKDWSWNFSRTGNHHHFPIMSPAATAAAAKSLQSCPTLCGPTDGSPPGSPVPGIPQAGILEWVAISSSDAWKWKVKVKSLSCVRLLATPWTAVYQAPPSMGFSRQEYWSGVPLPSPMSPASIR